MRLYAIDGGGTPTPTPTPNTTPGNNVTVQGGSGAVSITFSQVTGGGTTTFTTIDPPSSAGAAPSGYTILGSGPAFDIATTATFTPPVTTCFSVSSVTDPGQFALVRILHSEAGQLVDRTILPPDSPAPDFASRRVCAQTSSLSPFVAALSPLITIGGRVTTPDGRGLSNAAVRLTDGSGNVRRVLSSSLGYYSFDNLFTGPYTINATSKRYRFSRRTVQAAGDLSNENFVGIE